MMEFQLNLDSSIETANPIVAGHSDTCWADVTERIARGDTKAFAIYYERFFGLMFQEARRTTQLDESTCLDIVQDSMLKVTRSIKRIDSEKQLAGWSRAVVKSSAYDWLRKKQRTDSQLAAMSLWSNENETNSDDDLTRQARLIWIEQQLLDQPAEIQQLFSLRYRLGWTLKRIAHSLGIKTGAVDGKLKRAIEKLRLQAQHEDIQ